MKPTALQAHPEGGAFQEVFRSAHLVEARQGSRAALTHIYFALERGAVSRFHRVTSDEVWNLYRGRLRLVLSDGVVVEEVQLDPAREEFCHVVPAGWWQAAVPLDGPALVGCSVGPGFAFRDFTLHAGELTTVIDAHPDLALFA